MAVRWQSDGSPTLAFDNNKNAMIQQGHVIQVLGSNLYHHGSSIDPAMMISRFKIFARSLIRSAQFRAKNPATKKPELELQIMVHLFHLLIVLLLLGCSCSFQPPLPFNHKSITTRRATTQDTDAFNPQKTVRKHRQKSKLEKWRIFNIRVHPDRLANESVQAAQEHLSIHEQYMHPAVMEALTKRLHKHVNIESALVVRRSLDARSRKKGSTTDPMYVYIVDVLIQSNKKLREQPGRMERVTEHNKQKRELSPIPSASLPVIKPKVIIVGAGPAGLLCALELVQQRGNNMHVVLLEQGQPVEKRGRHIGALMHRRILDAHSNFCFGEGGAGTWSDGKLTTRIGRNSGDVRSVLETLVRYGAPDQILVEGSPHLGTDNLVRLLRNMRMELMEMGVEIRFGTKVTELVIEDRVTKGVTWESVDERGEGRQSGQLACDALVLATGHSSRETYEQLHTAGVQLEAKGFALGFRVEHPQKLITRIQYGQEWGRSVVTGKKLTDKANQDFFDSQHSVETKAKNTRIRGKLPVPSYRLATQFANDGERDRGCYSFCMCPGGQIVPASTNPEEVCVNGMSFSKRDSQFANSALVVTIAPDDPLLEPYRNNHGVLAGIAFQRDMERRAAVMGGGDLVVPVQRLTDFLDGRASSSAAPSSYRLGVKPSACHDLFPTEITQSLQHSLMTNIEKSMPGFISDQGLLHGVETRTSSPLRILRHEDTLEAIGTEALFPSGEGAGFAGGIISAAVDGLKTAHAVLQKFGLEAGKTSGKSKNLFHY